MIAWLLANKDFMPLFGAATTIVGAAIIAYLATARLNKSMKQTEFFLKFAERYHVIMQNKHQLAIRLADDAAGEKKISKDTAEKEAHEIYRQLFGLMFDEFFAYQEGFLARRAFREWMLWRNNDYRESDKENPNSNIMIGTVSYKKGWERYIKSPVVRSEFIDFLKAIHDIEIVQGPPPEVDAVKVEEVIRDYRWPRKSVRGRIMQWLREYPIFIGVIGWGVLGVEFLRAIS